MTKRKCKKRDIKSVEVNRNDNRGTRWIRKCVNCGQDQDTQHLPGNYKHNINGTKTKTFKIEWESKSKDENNNWTKDILIDVKHMVGYLMSEGPCHIDVITEISRQEKYITSIQSAFTIMYIEVIWHTQDGAGNDWNYDISVSDIDKIIQDSCGLILDVTEVEGLRI